MRTRKRWHYILAAAVVVPVGLFTRQDTTVLPSFIRKYGGDTLWAVLFFILFAVLFHRASTLRVTLVTLVFVFGIELLQLANWPWLDHVRDNRIGGFLLGTTFLWSDLFCLAVGILLAAVVDYVYINTGDAIQ